MTVPLECHQLVKAFNAQPVLHNISLTVQRGELVALLGPSGCGKTTTLRLIAGFEWPDEGTITISGRMVAGKGAHVVNPGKGGGGQPVPPPRLINHQKRPRLGIARRRRQPRRFQALVD